MLRFWRKRTLGVWNDKRFRPWDPNNLRMDLVVDTAALKAEMTLTVPDRSPVCSLIATCGLFFQPCWKFTNVLFELINGVRT